LGGLRLFGFGFRKGCFWPFSGDLGRVWRPSRDKIPTDLEGGLRGRFLVFLGTEGKRGLYFGFGSGGLRNSGSGSKKGSFWPFLGDLRRV
jgi:hypothetical protein